MYSEIIGAILKTGANCYVPEGEFFLISLSTKLSNNVNIIALGGVAFDIWRHLYIIQINSQTFKVRNVYGSIGQSQD